MFYCLVVGSRSFNDYLLLQRKLDALLANQSEVTIVSGGAKGADAFARIYANRRGYTLKEFPADWSTYGKSAGYRRNREMHEFIAQFEKRGVVAFWDGKSKGTAHSFELAKEFGNPIRVVKF